MEIIELTNKLMGNMTVDAFARKIGAPKISVETVIYGKRGAGVKFLRRLALAYPTDKAVRKAILNYIYTPPAQAIPETKAA